METGCRLPSGRASPGMVRSCLGCVASSAEAAADFRASMRSVAAFFSSLSFCPYSRLSSGAMVRNCSIRAVISPFFPRKRIRACSASLCVVALSCWSSWKICSMASFMVSLLEKSCKGNHFPSFLSAEAAFSALARRLSRSFWALAPPLLRYFFHCSSEKKRWYVRAICSSQRSQMSW